MRVLIRLLAPPTCPLPCLAPGRRDDREAYAASCAGAADSNSGQPQAAVIIRRARQVCVSQGSKESGFGVVASAAAAAALWGGGDSSSAPSGDLAAGPATPHESESQAVFTVLQSSICRSIAGQDLVEAALAESLSLALLVHGASAPAGSEASKAARDFLAGIMRACGIVARGSFGPGPGPSSGAGGGSGAGSDDAQGGGSTPMEDGDGGDDPSSLQVRGAHLVATLLAGCPLACSLARASGATSALLALCHAALGDPLLAMNALGCLPALATSPEGARVLLSEEKESEGSTEKGEEEGEEGEGSGGLKCLRAVAGAAGMALGPVTGTVSASREGEGEGGGEGPLPEWSMLRQLGEGQIAVVRGALQVSVEQMRQLDGDTPGLAGGLGDPDGFLGVQCAAVLSKVHCTVVQSLLRLAGEEALVRASSSESVPPAGGDTQLGRAARMVTQSRRAVAVPVLLRATATLASSSSSSMSSEDTSQLVSAACSLLAQDPGCLQVALRKFPRLIGAVAEAATGTEPELRQTAARCLARVLRASAVPEPPARAGVDAVLAMAASSSLLREGGDAAGAAAAQSRGLILAKSAGMHLAAVLQAGAGALDDGTSGASDAPQDTEAAPAPSSVLLTGARRGGAGAGLSARQAALLAERDALVSSSLDEEAARAGAAGATVSASSGRAAATGAGAIESKAMDGGDGDEDEAEEEGKGGGTSAGAAQSSSSSAPPSGGHASASLLELQGFACSAEESAACDASVVLSALSTGASGAVIMPSEQLAGRMMLAGVFRGICCGWRGGRLPSDRKRGEDDLSPEARREWRSTAPRGALPRSLAETLSEEYTAWVHGNHGTRRAGQTSTLPALAHNVLLPHPDEAHKLAGYDLLLALAAQPSQTDSSDTTTVSSPEESGPRAIGWGQLALSSGAPGLVEALLAPVPLPSLALAEARMAVLRALSGRETGAAARAALGDALYAAVESRGRAGVGAASGGGAGQPAVSSEHL